MDYYVELSDESRASLSGVKKALMEKLGLVKDSLSAGCLLSLRTKECREKL